MMKKTVWILGITGIVAAALLWALRPSEAPNLVKHAPQARKSVEKPSTSIPTITRTAVSPQEATSAPIVSSRHNRTFDLDTLITENRNWSREECERFVKSNGGSAQSLIAAYLSSKDPVFLETAAEHFPDHPMVQMQMIHSDTFSDQRKTWIEALKQTTPNNALANYLAAIDRHEDGNLQQALNEIVKGNNKEEFLQFHQEIAQIREEFFEENGYDSLGAKAKALFSIELPYLNPMRNLAKDLAEEVVRLQKQGNEAAATQLAWDGISMAQQLSLDRGNNTLVNQLVGISIEQTFLEHLDGNASYFDTHTTVGDARESIIRQRKELTRLTKKFNELSTLGDERLIGHYLDRVKLFGEFEALKWLDQQP